jgi:hypothetical protein
MNGVEASGSAATVGDSELSLQQFNILVILDFGG